MYFLNPAAFWAFTLLLVPIVIHLFNLRRVKKIYFSNLSFLKDVSQQSKSRSNLRKFLVLMLRMLAFTFLIMAFARPVFVEDVPQSNWRDQLIYLDNSYSMQQTDATGEPLLYVGHAVVDDEIRRIHELGRDVRYLDNDGSLLLKEGAKEEVSNMVFSPFALGWNEVAQKVRLYHPETLHIFSDMQRNVVLPMDELLNDTSMLFFIHKLSSSSDKNIYVDSLYLDGALGLVQENSLKVIVRNTGKDPAENVLIKVEKQGQQFASYTTNVEAKSRTEIRVNLGGTEVSGDYKILLEDNPVVFDNAFFFRIAPLVKSTVVILSERGMEVSSYFEKVFSNKAYFKVISDHIDNVSYDNLLHADLIILAGLERIPSWFASQYPQMKGRVLLVPTYGIDAESYQALLQLNVSTKPTDRSTISAKSLDNPFFDGVFKRKSESMSLPEAETVYLATGFLEPVLTMNTGEDFLIKSGQGSIYFLTSPLTDSATNFHKHSLFVPVMYRLAQSANNFALFYRMDEELIRLRVDSVFRPEVLELVGMNETLIPPYHFREGQIVLEVSHILKEPGFYDLIAEGDTLQRVAINYPKEESEITSISSGEMRQLLGGYDHIRYEEIDSGASFLGNASKGQKSDSIWKYALILALIFLVAESLLLRFNS